MIRSKKGFEGLEWYSLIIAIIVALIAFVVAAHNHTKEMENYIGKYQFQIMKSATKSEKFFLYLEQSAQSSFNTATSEFAKNGGFSEQNEISDEYIESECGKFKDAYVWFEISRNYDKTEVRDCIDLNSLRANFEMIFSEQMQLHILQYPENIQIGNFQYDIGEKEIQINTINPISFDILRKDNPLDPETKADIEKFAKENQKTPITSSKFKDFSQTKMCPKGADCTLTEDAYNLLLKAQKLAQEKGFSLHLIEGYRSEAEQITLWEKWGKLYPDENKRRKYVCYPFGSDVKSRCPHLSGNAVDIKLEGKQMDLQDRKLLEDLMTDAGWVRYEKEWWHFECCGTARYARANQNNVDVVS